MGYQTELEFALRLVREASRIILEHYEHAPEIHWKGKDDPVTDADEAVTVHILRRLGEEFPKDAVLIEERGDDRRRLSGMRTWIVDPLDGTREFIERNGEFSVMVGFVENGRPVVGAVGVPVAGEVYGGAIGLGAFCEKEGQRRMRSLLRKAKDLGDATLIVSRSHRSAKIDLLKERLGITKEKVCGSVGLKMIKVISGEADLYIHFGKGIKLWDTCSPEAIARAVGVMFTDLSGRNIDYLSGSVGVARGIIVAESDLHAVVVSCIGDLISPSRFD